MNCLTWLNSNMIGRRTYVFKDMRSISDIDAEVGLAAKISLEYILYIFQND